MVETYAFLAMFTVQILAMSVLYPAWFIRYVRVRTARFSVERLAQLYPGVDVARAQERFLSQYRTLAATVAALGLVLLIWLFGYMRRPNWDDGPVEMLVAIYFGLQSLPIFFVGWLGIRFNQAHKRAARDGKRKAVLQRRGLFDFVSPSAVFLAVLAYCSFAGLVAYLNREPFSGFAGYINLGAITLVYALNAGVVYTMLYGKSANPLDTHADRLHTIGLTVKSSIYSCIACVVFLSLNFTLVMLDLQRWEPFALSIFFVICALLASMGVMSPPRVAEPDGLA